ncbi:uncharacterized protein LOC120105237 [Phoenix dactylifera]|uniref:Uncharacterized protein LOC120105237 n=1 Tax=Phoenix dactylifera TaxID=42345 RepID=A0A8B8ZJH0_PHODC|nr:uncharacterized protein LOC120105237 [Phoenix dactylifera]
MAGGSRGRAPTNQTGEASHSSGLRGQSTPETVAGNQTWVLELIEEVIGLVRQQRQQPQQLVQQDVAPPEQRRIIAEFKRMAPSAFKGTTSPQEAQAWIDKMEKAFRAMECIDEEKEALTWQRFRTAFYSKYFPAMSELEREFLNLNQETMTVDKYEAEFDRLSRFAPTLVMDAESRMWRFEEGLKPHLRRGLAAVHSANYDDLVDRAKNMKIVWKETQESKDRIQKKRSRDDDTHSGQNSSKTAKSHNQSCQSGKQGSYGKTTQQEKPKCGQRGHKVVEYPQQDLRSVQRPQTTRTQQVQASPALAQSAQPSSPKQQKGGRPRTPGCIYVLTQQDAQASNTVMSGTLLVASVYAHTLYDSGATHFFVSSTFMRKHDLLCVPLEYDLHVSTPAGNGMIGNQLASHFAIINCNEKQIKFQIPGDTEFSFVGSGAYTSS